ncbi:MAG: UvrD-helicase domain-containing protein [Acidobacteriota bacterium]
MFTPTAEQKKLIDSSDSAVVIAGPGRGKTLTAIAAADTWATAHPSRRVLFTSYSNTAVRRIAEVGGIQAQRASLDFRTFHSVAFDVLADYGRFVGLQQPAQVLDKPAEHLAALEEEWPDDDSEYAAARHAYARRTGHVAFADMIPLASALLASSSTLCRAVQRRYGCLIVDEFQDTTAEQTAFLRLLGGDGRLLAFGDPHQMIYESDFDSARSRFVSTAQWKSVDVTTFEGRNYRCAATDILDFAEAVLHGERFSGHSGSVACDGMYANQRRSYIALRCQSIWKRFPGSSIGIIAPNSRTERELAAELRAPKKGVKAAIPVHAVIEVDPAWADAFRLATFAASDYAREPNMERRRCFAVTLTALERASRRGTPPGIARLGEIEKLLSSSSKRKSALRDFLASPQPGSVSDFAVRFAASLSGDKAFDAVGHRIEKSGVPAIRPIAGVEQFDTFRASRNPAGLHGAECWRARTTMLSMYRAKGREFDHVIVVTDPRAHKKDAAEGELRRLHYVACTRARQTLTVLWNSSGIGDVLGPVLA